MTNDSGGDFNESGARKRRKVDQKGNQDADVEPSGEDNHGISQPGATSSDQSQTASPSTQLRPVPSPCQRLLSVCQQSLRHTFSRLLPPHYHYVETSHERLVPSISYGAETEQQSLSEGFPHSSESYSYTETPQGIVPIPYGHKPNVSIGENFRPLSAAPGEMLTTLNTQHLNMPISNAAGPPEHLCDDSCILRERINIRAQLFDTTTPFQNVSSAVLQHSNSTFVTPSQQELNPDIEGSDTSNVIESNKQECVEASGNRSTSLEDKQPGRIAQADAGDSETSRGTDSSVSLSSGDYFVSDVPISPSIDPFETEHTRISSEDKASRESEKRIPLLDEPHTQITEILSSSTGELSSSASPKNDSLLTVVRFSTNIQEKATMSDMPGTGKRELHASVAGTDGVRSEVVALTASSDQAMPENQQYTSVPVLNEDQNSHPEVASQTLSSSSSLLKCNPSYLGMFQDQPLDETIHEVEQKTDHSSETATWCQKSREQTSDIVGKNQISNKRYHGESTTEENREFLDESHISPNNQLSSSYEPNHLPANDARFQRPRYVLGDQPLSARKQQYQIYSEVPTRERPALTDQTSRLHNTDSVTGAYWVPDAERLTCSNSPPLERLISVDDDQSANKSADVPDENYSTGDKSSESEFSVDDERAYANDSRPGEVCVDTCEIHEAHCSAAELSNGRTISQAHEIQMQAVHHDHGYVEPNDAEPILPNLKVIKILNENSKVVENTQEPTCPPLNDTHNSSPMQAQYTIRFDRKPPVYEASEKVHGEFSICFKKNTRFEHFHLRLIGAARLTVDEPDQGTSMTMRENFLVLGCFTWANDFHNKVARQGVYIFPFEFIIPAHSPHYYEDAAIEIHHFIELQFDMVPQQLSKLSNIRYAETMTQSPWLFCAKIFVRSKPDPYSSIAYKPAAMKTSIVLHDVTNGDAQFKLNVKARVHRTVFAPGDVVDLRGTITDVSDVDVNQQTRVTLMPIITQYAFTTSGFERSLTLHRVVCGGKSKEKQLLIGAKQEKTFCFHLEIGQILPSTFLRSKPWKFYVNYFLKLVVNIPGMHYPRDLMVKQIDIIRDSDIHRQKCGKGHELLRTTRTLAAPQVEHIGIEDVSSDDENVKQDATSALGKTCENMFKEVKKNPNKYSRESIEATTVIIESGLQAVHYHLTHMKVGPKDAQPPKPLSRKEELERRKNKKKLGKVVAKSVPLVANADHDSHSVCMFVKLCDVTKLDVGTRKQRKRLRNHLERALGRALRYQDRLNQLAKTCKSNSTDERNVGVGDSGASSLVMSDQNVWTISIHAAEKYDFTKGMKMKSETRNALVVQFGGEKELNRNRLALPAHIYAIDWSQDVDLQVHDMNKYLNKDGPVRNSETNNFDDLHFYFKPEENAHTPEDFSTNANTVSKYENCFNISSEHSNINNYVEACETRDVEGSSEGDKTECNGDKDPSDGNNTECNWGVEGSIEGDKADRDGDKTTGTNGQSYMLNNLEQNVNELDGTTLSDNTHASSLSVTNPTEGSNSADDISQTALGDENSKAKHKQCKTNRESQEISSKPDIGKSIDDNEQDVKHSLDVAAPSTVEEKSWITEKSNDNSEKTPLNTENKAPELSQAPVRNAKPKRQVVRKKKAKKRMIKKRKPKDRIVIESSSEEESHNESDRNSYFSDDETNRQDSCHSKGNNAVEMPQTHKTEAETVEEVVELNSKANSRFPPESNKCMPIAITNAKPNGAPNNLKSQTRSEILTNANPWCTTFFGNARKPVLRESMVVEQPPKEIQRKAWSDISIQNITEDDTEWPQLSETQKVTNKTPFIQGTAEAQLHGSLVLCSQPPLLTQDKTKQASLAVTMAFEMATKNEVQSTVTNPTSPESRDNGAWLEVVKPRARKKKDKNTANESFEKCDQSTEKNGFLLTSNTSRVSTISELQPEQGRTANDIHLQTTTVNDHLHHSFKNVLPQSARDTNNKMRASGAPRQFNQAECKREISFENDSSNHETELQISAQDSCCSGVKVPELTIPNTNSTKDENYFAITNSHTGDSNGTRDHKVNCTTTLCKVVNESSKPVISKPSPQNSTNNLMIIAEQSRKEHIEGKTVYNEDPVDMCKRKMFRKEAIEGKTVYDANKPTSACGQTDNCETEMRLRDIAEGSIDPSSRHAGNIMAGYLITGMPFDNRGYFSDSGFCVSLRHTHYGCLVCLRVALLFPMISHIPGLTSVLGCVPDDITSMMSTYTDLIDILRIATSRIRKTCSGVELVYQVPQYGRKPVLALSYDPCDESARDIHGSQFQDDQQKNFDASVKCEVEYSTRSEHFQHYDIQNVSSVPSTQNQDATVFGSDQRLLCDRTENKVDIPPNVVSPESEQSQHVSEVQNTSHYYNATSTSHLGIKETVIAGVHQVDVQNDTQKHNSVLDLSNPKHDKVTVQLSTHVNQNDSKVVNEMGTKQLRSILLDKKQDSVLTENSKNDNVLSTHDQNCNVRFKYTKTANRQQTRDAGLSQMVYRENRPWVASNDIDVPKDAGIPSTTFTAPGSQYCSRESERLIVSDQMSSDELACKQAYECYTKVYKNDYVNTHFPQTMYYLYKLALKYENRVISPPSNVPRRANQMSGRTNFGNKQKCRRAAYASCDQSVRTFGCLSKNRLKPVSNLREEFQFPALMGNLMDPQSAATCPNAEYQPFEALRHIWSETPTPVSPAGPVGSKCVRSHSRCGANQTPDLASLGSKVVQSHYPFLEDDSILRMGEVSTQLHANLQNKPDTIWTETPTQSYNFMPDNSTYIDSIHSMPTLSDILSRENLPNGHNLDVTTAVSSQHNPNLTEPMASQNAHTDFSFRASFPRRRTNGVLSDQITAEESDNPRNSQLRYQILNAIKTSVERKEKVNVNPVFQSPENNPPHPQELFKMLTDNKQNSKEAKPATLINPVKQECKQEEMVPETKRITKKPPSATQKSASNNVDKKCEERPTNQQVASHKPEATVVEKRSLKTPPHFTRYQNPEYAYEPTYRYPSSRHHPSLDQHPLYHPSQYHPTLQHPGALRSLYTWKHVHSRRLPNTAHAYEPSYNQSQYDPRYQDYGGGYAIDRRREKTQRSLPTEDSSWGTRGRRDVERRAADRGRVDDMPGRFPRSTFD